MAYAVHSMFLTQQGEGANLGRTCVFLRFTGCNLWSGRDEDRASAVCRFCDTDFVGGVRYTTATALADAVSSLWPAGQSHRRTVLTGGEPLLQVDDDLLEALHRRGFWIAVETNGTRSLPGPVDWVCLSPKAGAPLVLAAANELKLVYPQAGSIQKASPTSPLPTTGCRRWMGRACQRTQPWQPPIAKPIQLGG